MGDTTASAADVEHLHEWFCWRTNSKAYQSTLISHEPTGVSSNLSHPGGAHQYRSLQDTQIRLLHLFPSPSGPDREHRKPLHGNLQHVQRAEAPPYASLSYTWGDPAKVDKISIGGKSLGIGENLAEALYHLREKETTLTIWIDAICINQDDEAEKSQQVNQMGDFFATAAMVLAWLGPATADSNLAIRKLDVLRRWIFDELCKAGLKHNRNRAVTSVVDLLTAQMIVGDGDEADIPVTALVNLSARPWWERLWIVQEMALAKSVIFVCGKDEIPSMYLQQSYFSLVLMNSRPVAGSPIWTDSSLRLQQNLKITPIVMLNACIGGMMHRNRPLIELLSSTITLSATNPRDRIFAILGLACDASALKISPDYSMSTEEVFIDAVSKLLSAGNLSVLSRVAHSRKLTNLPSWVQDFSQTETGDTTVTEDQVFTITQRFSAGMSKLGSRNIELPHIEHKVLRLGGVVVSSVAELHIWQPSDTSSTLRLSSSFLLSVDVFARARATEYRTEEQISEIVWRLPIGNSQYRYSEEEHHSGRPGVELYESYKAVRGFNVPLNELNTDDWRLRHGLPYVREMNERMGGKIIFVSSTGHLGYARHGLREGDQIVIFYGAEVPYLLRPASNGHFYLVAECFLDNVMFGEFLEDNPAEMVFDLV